MDHAHLEPGHRLYPGEPRVRQLLRVRIAERFRGGSSWPQGFDVTLRPRRLDEPLRWRETAYVFVNSMSDLFHKNIPDDYLRQVWDVMLQADHHTYQVLTKRAHRMA